MKKCNQKNTQKQDGLSLLWKGEEKRSGGEGMGEDTEVYDAEIRFPFFLLLEATHCIVY